jgi:hypothetical protein
MVNTDMESVYEMQAGWSGVLAWGGYDSPTTTCTKVFITNIAVTVLPPDIRCWGWYFFIDICRKTGTSPKPCTSHSLPLSPLPHPARSRLEAGL